jgi:transcriptional regulator with XRE-family HTH domain
MAVDPRFGTRLRELRRQRGLSLRDLASLAHYGKSYVSELEIGQKRPTVEAAASLDRALDANGELARMVSDAADGLWTSDDEERLRYVVRDPRRVDTATIASLQVILAHQRRLEDNIGSAALVAPVTAELAMLERLVDEAADNDLRRDLLDTAAQWAQFAAWLSVTTGDNAGGRTRYLRAMEWATEAGNPHMVATALSMRGHLAWMQGRHRSMIELSKAAGWQPASLSVRAMAIQQEGRGLALVGDARGCDDRMSRAEDMAREAAEHPDDQPPWLYFYDPNFLRMQRGVAQLYLGSQEPSRYEQAVPLLSDALDELPSEIRHSGWVGWYLARLAPGHAALGDREAAIAVLEEARHISEDTGTEWLRSYVERRARKLDL